MCLEVDVAPKDAGVSVLSLDGTVRLGRRGKADPEAGGGSMEQDRRAPNSRNLNGYFHSGYSQNTIQVVQGWVHAVRPCEKRAVPSVPAVPQPDPRRDKA